jgi:hypothetical protein
VRVVEGRGWPMSLRRVRPKARGYHAFPWSKPAMRSAVAMFRPLRGMHRVTLRTIAADLFARGLVPHLPDPATVRRMLSSPAALEIQLQLELKDTHGKNGLAELEAVKEGGNQP